jgi:protein CMS1
MGDDLGDYEFLMAPIRDDGDEDDAPAEKIVKERVEKRKDPVDDDKAAEATESATAVSKKRKKGGGNTLRDLGHNICSASTDTQAKLLSEFSGVKIVRQNVASSKEAAEFDLGVAKRIQSIVSKKKLKKWKTKESPCVLIICLSARRAVQILKEIAPLNVRAAKLFAKHMVIEDQVKQLEESAFGIAIGTPHRILTLAQQGALSLEDTQCIVLDTFLNDKKYSVYTLPDTVPHTQGIIKEYAHPQLQKRRDLRIAFV